MNRKQVLAIFLTAVMIAALVVYYEINPSIFGGKPHTQPQKLNLSLGPRLLVNDLSGTGPNNSTSTSTTTLQVFAAVPDAFNLTGQKNFNLLSMNIMNNSKYVELLNTTISGNQSVQFLSSGFNSISNQWKFLFSNNFFSTNTSLTVLAYRTVYSNDNISVYSYYNNIQYKPENIVTLNASLNSSSTDNWFNGSVIVPSSYKSINYDNTTMNLSIVFSHKPTQVFQASSPGQNKYLTYAAPEYVNYTDRHDMHSEVILPLLGFHLSSAVSSGSSTVDFYSEFPSLNDGLFFNSANVYDPVSGGTLSSMSTVPSYGNIGAESSVYTYGPANVTPQSISMSNGMSQSKSNNLTTGFSGISGVTYSFVHYSEQTVLMKGNRGSTSVALKNIPDGNGTIAQVSSIISVTGPVFHAGNVPIEVNSIIMDILHGSRSGFVPLNASGLSSLYYGTTIESNILGYSGASISLETITGGQTTFSTPLGLGLALSDAISITNASSHTTSLSTIISASLAMINETTGLQLNAPAMMSTISYVAGIFPGGVSTAFYNEPSGSAGSNYSIQYYESPYTESFTSTSGTTYSFYSPLDYMNATSILS